MNKKKRLCIYHDDSDGKMAAIYKEHLKAWKLDKECRFIEASHVSQEQVVVYFQNVNCDCNTKQS